MVKSKRKNSTEKNEKKLCEKWQSWLAPILTVLLILGAIFLLPKKFVEFKEIIIPRKNSCFFHGRIIDKNNNPVVKAEVIVQGDKGSGITDDNGEFNFKVKSKPGTRVQIFVKINGFIQYNGSETLPGPITIKLMEMQ